MARRAVWAAVIAAVCWALTGIFVKEMAGVPLGTLVWQRFVLSLLVLTLLGLRAKGDTPEADTSTPHQLRADAGLASCMTAYYICATAGFVLGPVALTSLIIALAPAVTLVWQLVATKRVVPRELIGFGVAVLGVVLYLAPLLSGTGRFGRTAIVVSAGAAMLATISRAVYTILLWHRTRRGIPIHAGRINRTTFLIGALALMPVFVAQAGRLSWSWADLLWLGALVVIATIVPNLLNTWASSRLAPTTNAIVGMLTPPVTGVLGWSLLDEPLTAIQCAGMALTLLGVAISTLRVRASAS
jgi:drug/metabolite transporter (DMT)-like permease